MYTMFMNSKNSQTSKRHVLVIKFTDKLNLKRGEKIITLSNLIIYCTWKNIKSHTITINLKNQHHHGMINLNLNKFDGSYSRSNIQDYFECILKKHGENIDKPSVKIYVNKIENRITFRIKNRYSLELLTPETMKLLGTTENKITKDKNGENVPHLKITEAVLVHRNIVNTDYQQDSTVLCTFVPNKPFGSLLEISPANHIFLKTLNSEFQTIEIWFADQNSEPLEIEHRINLTLVIK